MNIKKYLVPFLLGFVGMLVAHIIILLAFGLGANFPIYFISYVIVFSMISYFLTRRNPQWWLSNIICLFLISFFYWYILLYSDGTFSWAYAIKITDASGMILILPVTLLLSMIIAALLLRVKNFN